jgi:putative transposase
VLELVGDPGAPNSEGGSLLDEIVRDGARQMLAALLAEVAAYVEAHRGEVNEQGRPFPLLHLARRPPTS